MTSTEQPIPALHKAGHATGPLEQLNIGAPNDLVEYRMAVVGMTCADCERHVADALLEAGAIEPTANFRHSKAKFSAPSTMEPQRFVDALARTPCRAGAIQRAEYERAHQPPQTAAQQTGLTLRLSARADGPSPRRSRPVSAAHARR